MVPGTERETAEQAQATITAQALDESRSRFHAPYKDRPKGTFPVMEIFGPTIQGEGILIGEKTHFIRMGGCDFRCKMCDSMHAVDPNAVKMHAEWLNPTQILGQLLKLDPDKTTPWVTLSGGNPAMWDLQELVQLLTDAGWKVAVETQGSIWRPWLGEVHMLTISPKPPGMGEEFHWDSFKKFLSHLSSQYNRQMGRMGACIKVPVFNQMDLEFVASLSELLDERMPFPLNTYQWFPRSARYISLGNPYPPQLREEDLRQHLDQNVEADLQYDLLKQYKILLEDYLKDPRLSLWKFLPQLHVLVWGNKAGV